MNAVKPGDHITVWFSCGAASAVAAKKTLEKYGEIATIRIVNNPVSEEHEDNQRFLFDVEKWLGVKIESAINPDYPSCSIFDVFEDRKYVSGPKGAPCTGLLKKKARQIWEQTNRSDWIVLGFTSDEERRAKRFAMTERDTLLPVLVDEKISKTQCYEMLLEAGIDLPSLYLLGWPNANCVGCVKASNPVYWRLVREHFPAYFDKLCEVTRRFGCRLLRQHPKYVSFCYQDKTGAWWNRETGECLTYTTRSGKTRVKDVRFFLDELAGWMRGSPIKNMRTECGIFCEERE